MELRDPRKVILDKLRNSRTYSDDRSNPNSLPNQIDPSGYLPNLDDLPEIVFARNLIQVGGKFAYCQDKKDLVLALRILQHEEKWKEVFCIEPGITGILDQAGLNYSNLPESLLSAEVAFTGCEFLIARTGSVLVSSAQGSGRRIFGHAPIHVVIARTGQLTGEIHEALVIIKARYDELPSQLSLITGPSRTADIEKTLVMGAHGPKVLYVFLYNDQSV